MPSLDADSRAARARQLAHEAAALADADLETQYAQIRSKVDELRRELEQALLLSDALETERDRRAIHRRVIAGE